jgi:hypothetical protein
MISFSQYLIIREKQEFKRHRKTIQNYRPMIKRSRKADAVKNAIKNSAATVQSTNPANDGSLDGNVAKSIGYDFLDSPLIQFE